MSRPSTDEPDISEPSTGESHTGDQNTAARRRSTIIGVNDVLRFGLELFTIFTLGYWGYLAWPFPWPALAFMIGTPLFAMVVWGLFRSPKAVIRVDTVGRGLVEIGVMGSAVIAWAMLGFPVVAIVFGLIALVSGIINIRNESAREESGTVIPVVHVAKREF